MPSHEQIQSKQNGREATAVPLHPLPLNRARLRQRVRWLAAMGIILAIGFYRPLYAWAQYSWHSELYSHCFLIPMISLYLVWLNREDLIIDAMSSPGLAVYPILAGVATLGGYWAAVYSGWKPQVTDYFALMTLSFLLFFLGGCFIFLGAAIVRRAAFPLAFLVFMLPFPESVRGAIETFSQHASADAAYVMLKLSGMPVFRDGLVFQLPGFSMQVAPECSGIRSSFILFITSLLAGHLFLRKWWTNTILLLAVIVLGILRNGFRIFTIGQLCVRVGHDMIDSVIHRRGGPYFFLLSLIPLFLLLLFLRKLERKSKVITSQ